MPEEERPLLDLATVNAERTAQYARVLPKGLGIACPEEGCGCELMDVSNGKMMMSNPPKFWAECEHGHRHTVVA